MTRMINVVEYDPWSGETRLAGRFDADKAEVFEEDTYWDGHNHAGVIGRDSTRSQYLYRTAGGRWVRRTDSQWANEQTSYEFLGPQAARDWLLRCGYARAVAECFAEDITAEFGPDVTPRLRKHLVGLAEALDHGDLTVARDELDKALALTAPPVSA